MDIRVLQYFLTVAKAESITKAAEMLNMTQPPLSRQMKDLEEELGKKLLIRGSKKITLTEDGILLCKRAEELVSLMEKTRSEIMCSDENISGDVHIGCAETEAISFFAKVAQTLQQKNAEIHYHLYSGDAEHIMSRLDKGLIDFGLVVGSVDRYERNYNCLQLPMKDVWGVLMHKSSPLSEKSEIGAEDLLDKPLIVPHQISSVNAINSWLQRDWAEYNIVATYNLIYNAAQFAKEKFGYVISLDGLINTTGDSQLCFRPLSPKLEIGLTIIWKKYQVFSKASNAFLTEIKNSIAAK